MKFKTGQVLSGLFQLAIYACTYQMYYGKLNVAMLFFSVNLYTQRNNYECCHVLFLCRGINGYPAAQSDSLFKHLNTYALTLKISAGATSMVLNLPISEEPWFKCRSMILKFLLMPQNNCLYSFSTFINHDLYGCSISRGDHPPTLSQLR